MNRCGWCGTDELYVRYHDEEWGVPLHDDYRLFEFLVLESAQAGLSWLTILKRREAYRRAYEGFIVEKVAAFDDKKVDELLCNPGIIRNKKKILSSIHNAKAFLEIQREYGSFDRFIWSFTEFVPVIGHYSDLSLVPARTALSDAICAELKNRGFQFLGSVIVYSFLQAVGIVDDHIDSCFRKAVSDNK